jgi:hypothetical protein
MEKNKLLDPVSRNPAILVNTMEIIQKTKNIVSMQPICIIPRYISKKHEFSTQKIYIQVYNNTIHNSQSMELSVFQQMNG